MIGTADSPFQRRTPDSNQASTPPNRPTPSSRADRADRPPPTCRFREHPAFSTTSGAGSETAALGPHAAESSTGGSLMVRNDPPPISLGSSQSTFVAETVAAQSPPRPGRLRAHRSISMPRQLTCRPRLESRLAARGRGDRDPPSGVGIHRRSRAEGRRLRAPATDSFGVLVASQDAPVADSHERSVSETS